MATDETRIAKALSTIKAWMQENDAPLLVENLAPGATRAELDAAEKKLGFPIPAQLRALWSVHHGQLEEQNGFVGHMDLLGALGSTAEAESVAMFLEFLRENEDDWEEAGITEEEVKSDRWLAFAGRGYADLLVVSGVSGRVFWCGKDSPALQRRAESVLEWLEEYAKGVEADDYEVEEGFGDYCLTKRDREREREDAEHEKEEKAHEQWRIKTPLLEQLKTALDDGDARLSRDVFEEAAKKAQLAEAVEVLFSVERAPALVATSVQYVLYQLTLTPVRWAKVAKGAEALGNNAVRDYAAARAG